MYIKNINTLPKGKCAYMKKSNQKVQNSKNTPRGVGRVSVERTHKQKAKTKLICNKSV